MSFETEVKERHEKLIELLESIDVDQLQSSGLTLSFGGKTFSFKDMEVTNNEDLEAKIKSEFKAILNDQQQKIRAKINEKINQLLIMHNQKAQEFERKEQLLQRKYRQAVKMPEINEVHAAKGLSVVKGASNGELIWLFRSVYNPRFVDRKTITTRLANKLKTDILIMVRTKDKTVTSVSTREYRRNSTGVLKLFDHYHQMGNGDCWGRWKHPTRWETPDDIIQIAKQAESVLDNINTRSVATQNPTNMPRLATIKKNVSRSGDSNRTITVDEREIPTAEVEDEDDVWTL